ncbi:BTB/POZ and MATH domain-containing protein 1-like [Hordeum vulgare subsp. vulgare]|uniref:BTB domain-containing protein n=1 Tax=Hordeum vulgare subsp. vulgare TaxID=112509 RepID=A0A8I6Z6E6_HORVV|nr:BTB/POZ and MATH domain-containing protein 1-like [Hordeum vulgare subsp. vulgare]
MSSSSSASAIVADKVSGHHLLKIDGYLGMMGPPSGESVTSCPFAVGGHLWRISCYPSGSHEWYRSYISLELVLAEEVETGVRAVVQFALMPQEQATFFRKNKPRIVRSGEHKFASHGSWRCPMFVDKTTLTKSKYLKDESFTIRCDILVFKKSRAQEGAAEPETAAPRSVSVLPSDLNRHLGGLLETGKGADVVFEVAGHNFAAHRWLLAARSPVFNAEFFGAMKGSDVAPGAVRIGDMEAPVFKAFLSFMYTDSMPEMAKKEEDAMYQHLLVAADRYNMERLKLICQDKLCRCRRIDGSSVANVLALAELHHCSDLKDACLEFLSIPANLREAMANDGFEHLSASCPSVVKELIAMCSSAP